MLAVGALVADPVPVAPAGQESPLPGLDFSQFGPYAIVLTLLSVAVVFLWREQKEAHRRALSRIDALEAELRERNAEDREQLRAARDALDEAERRTGGEVATKGTARRRT